MLTLFHRPSAPHLSQVSAARNNRSKFNVALGIEAQGFRVLR